jgi:hypothetical protein
MAIANGDIKIYIRNGRVGAETSMDPVLASLCLIKVAIKLLEEQVSGGSSLLKIEGLVIQ